jgi:Protein of unknown function (DUF3761)
LAPNYGPGRSLAAHADEAFAYACKDRYYLNSSGHMIHSPSSGREPEHQTAVCRNGSLSFSEHHGETCSSHRGSGTPGMTATQPKFRLQLFGPATDRGQSILEEVDVQVADLAGVVRDTMNTPWPSKAIGLRFVDVEGRVVFERLRADIGWR